VRTSHGAHDGEAALVGNSQPPARQLALRRTAPYISSMIRTAVAFALVGCLLACNQAAAQEVQRSAYHDFRVVTVADGLEVPWSLAWLPDGDLLVTERPGRLRIVRDGTLLPDPVPSVPEVFARGQGGLFDVLPHPDFATNRLLYLSYARPKGGGSTTAVVRGRFENDRFTAVEDVFESQSQGRGHYGGRLAWDGDGYLFVSVGDRMARTSGDLSAHPAQDLSNHHGVTVRLHDDGRVPDDNPFAGQDGALPAIWSYGHRNPQGLLVHPETGALWANEHGPQGGDELNRILPGLNYGWPVVGYGVNYGSGTAIHAGTRGEGMESPAHFWVPSIATSGLMVYTGDRFPLWKGSFFVGGMAGRQLARLIPSVDRPGRIEQEETLAHGIGRVRDVRQGPDGDIYLAIEQRGRPGQVVRLEPVARR
jgi:glucose/arabinose dehydrogenase